MLPVAVHNALRHLPIRRRIRAASAVAELKWLDGSIAVSQIRVCILQNVHSKGSHIITLQKGQSQIPGSRRTLQMCSTFGQFDVHRGHMHTLAVFKESAFFGVCILRLPNSPSKGPVFKEHLHTPFQYANEAVSSLCCISWLRHRHHHYVTAIQPHDIFVSYLNICNTIDEGGRGRTRLRCPMAAAKYRAVWETEVRKCTHGAYFKSTKSSICP